MVLEAALEIIEGLSAFDVATIEEPIARLWWKRWAGRRGKCSACCV